MEPVERCGYGAWTEPRATAPDLHRHTRCRLPNHQAKGATYYAIALALDRICAATPQDQGAVLKLSTLLDNYLGVSDVYIGVPCVVDRTGIRNVLELTLSDEETALFQKSANKLKGLIQSIRDEMA